MDEILISPGYGAGWSTWASGRNGEMAKYIARYQPIIDFLQQGGEFVEHTRFGGNYEEPWEDFEEPGQAILKALCLECKERFDEMPYLGGAVDLVVRYASDPAEVYEYDGYESLTPFGAYSV